MSHDMSFIHILLPHLRTLKDAPVDSDVTIVMPDFPRSEVDTLMRVLYGLGLPDGEDGVSEELFKALGCSYEVSQLMRTEGETATGPLQFDSRVSSLLEKAISDWDTKDDSGRFLCPEQNCDYANMLRKRVRNHLGAVHRKVVCPQCGDVINRKEMEQHFKGKHALKEEVKLEKDVRRWTFRGVVENDIDSDEQLISSAKHKNEHDAWAKESDEDYEPPPKKRTKKGRKPETGGGDSDGGSENRKSEKPGKVTCAYCNKKVSLMRSQRLKSASYNALF